MFNSKKMFATAVAFTMVLSLVAVPASAQTTAELTAQINSLLAMIAQLQAQIAGSAGTGSATMFNTDLTVGSTGADVVALQTWLVGKGLLTMPAGVAMGYFGNLTKSALAAYQASVGITPAVGYFGPITRAKVNSLVVVPVVPGTVPGSTGITTPGVEGTLTVTNSTAGLVSTAYEGDSKAAILGFKAQAKTSDIAIQRVKIDLGTDTKVYTAFYKTLYLTDTDGNVIKSVDLNSSTVVKESNNYYATLSGFSYVVSKDTTKQMYIKADLWSNIDSADITAQSPQVITLADSGVRGVDGAGIDQYSPTEGTDVTKSITIAATLSDSASLKVSLNSSTPKKQDVIADGGSGNDELDKLTVLVFDLKAEKDNVLVTDIRIGVVDQGDSGAATVATAYLFDGSTELDNAAITTDMATFADIDFTVLKDTTKTLTVKVDVRDANVLSEGFIASASTTAAADLVSENSSGDSITETGSATGNEVGIRSAGPEITLVSKSITTANTPQGSQLAGATSTLTASFTVKVKAVGADLLLGTIGSTTGAMFGPSGSIGSFVVYRNGVAVTTLSNSTSTAYTVPSTCTTGVTQSCTLPDGSEVTIPVTYLIEGRTATVGTAAASGLYAIGLEQINWVSSTSVLSTSTFMSGETDWRTSDVSFP